MLCQFLVQNNIHNETFVAINAVDEVSIHDNALLAESRQSAVNAENVATHLQGVVLQYQQQLGLIQGQAPQQIEQLTQRLRKAEDDLRQSEMCTVQCQDMLKSGQQQYSNLEARLRTTETNLQNTQEIIFGNRKLIRPVKHFIK